MMDKNLVAVVCGCVCFIWTCCCQAQSGKTEPGLVGYWPFDGDMKDVSGGRHATGPKMSFADGIKGKALTPTDYRAQIPDSPALQLFAGIAIDCWVYFDKPPEGYVQLVHKDKEYQLRVDASHEGGQFAFFVFLDGWEPRVRGGVPEAGRWHHLVAKWTGTELSLEVDGKKHSTRRAGPVVQTNNPVAIGGLPGRMDELKVFNPRFLAQQWLRSLARDANRSPQSSFGASEGWTGWTAGLGASMTQERGALMATFPNASAMLAHPNLNMDLAQKHFLSLDIDCPTAQESRLVFLTDKHYGEAPVTLWGANRTAVVNLALHPHWRGSLQALALTFPDGQSHRARIERLRLSDKPDGKPFLYARSLSPERAILRVGREEKIVAIVRNLGGVAKRAEAKLSTPRGVEVLGDATRTLTDLAHNAAERVEWVVKTKKPVEGRADVTLSADGLASSRRDVAVRFVPSPSLPKASYVPPPRPARSPYLVLMHYCALWKLGTHYGWGKIEPWPDRRPAIGFYDEGTPEVADWHIKYALEHGVQGFIYCWYRADLKPTITHTLGHAIHDGLLKARYVDQFKFAIMWENGGAQGVKDRDDLMDNLLPYWMDNYFKHPSYVKIDNKPLLYIWVPSRVHAQLGGPEGTRKAFDDMRAVCRQQGFDGLHIVGCVGNADKRLLEDMGKAGWDASSAYVVWPGPPEQLARDVEGIATFPHREATLAQKDVLLGKRAVGALPDIACVMMGWDPRPWHGAKTSSYQANPTPENFEAACRNAKQIVDSTPGNGLDKRVVVLDNWCEFGEGHYLEPTAGFGFQFLDAARRVFCDTTEPCVDITPEDVGLELPERAYKAYRAIVGPSGSLVKRNVVGNLIAAWAFDEDHETLALDSSACDFKGFKQHFESAPGRHGKAFRCKGGWVSLEAHELFFPLSGLTVELWFKTDVAGQSDKWMLNTVGRSDTGYRLGLTGGKLSWQIPQTPWSHILVDPDPAPLGQWTHVAATYDNKALRLFVNGVEKARLAREGAIQPSEAQFCIGNYSPGHPRAFFEGLLDEVRIHDRALSADEIIRRVREP